MNLKASLKSRPVIYEIVPPRRETSKFVTELREEEVLRDSRIAAVSIPELIKRERAKGKTYTPVTIPPEAYALMIKEYKEPIVDIIAPRLPREEFLKRARRILHEFRVPNLVLVGKERHSDILPGPTVTEALDLLAKEKKDGIALGGICIFGRESSGIGDYWKRRRRLEEHTRVWLKAKAGCDFVTSQITFDPKPVLNFLTAYQELCERTGTPPITVFISLTTVPTRSILSLLDDLDVIIPPKVRKDLEGSYHMGRESLRVATDVFTEIITEVDQRGIVVPIGVQIEQVGMYNIGLSLELIDAVVPILRH